jgi:type IV pilus assembly protein PilV
MSSRNEQLGNPPPSSTTLRLRSIKKSQQGFGLIEVMVAIVVLSIGMFGIVLSQLNSMRGQRGAHARATAIQLASDLAERMRLNTAAIGTGTEAYADPATTTYVSLTSSAPKAPNVPSDFSSTPQATFDLDAWRYEVSRRLGLTNATGVVREITGKPMSRTVVVMWQDAQPTKALADAGTSKRLNDCPTGSSAAALVCDKGCPSDGTVLNAPLNVRCVVIGIQP